MNTINVQDTIPGTNFIAIQAAMKVLTRREIDLNAFTIVVAGGDNSVLLLANDPKPPVGTPPCFGVKGGADTEMNDRDLSIELSKLDQIKPQEKHQGRHFLAAQAAADVFLRRFDADLSRYRIDVLREGDSLVVIFAGKDVAPGTHGNIVGTPGFEVELAPLDLSVLRSNFVR